MYKSLVSNDVQAIRRTKVGLLPGVNCRCHAYPLAIVRVDLSMKNNSSVTVYEVRCEECCELYARFSTLKEIYELKVGKIRLSNVDLVELDPYCLLFNQKYGDIYV